MCIDVFCCVNQLFKFYPKIDTNLDFSKNSIFVEVFVRFIHFVGDLR